MNTEKQNPLYTIMKQLLQILPTEDKDKLI